MLVLAAVPEIQVLRLRRAAGARFGFVSTGAWGDVVDLICRQPIELAVVDPMLSGEPRSQEIERLRLLFPSLPVLLYTTFTPALAPVLLALGRQGVQEVVFCRLDDHPDGLRTALEREQARACSQQLLEQISQTFAPLRAEIRWLLEGALRAPEGVQTVEQLAASAGVGRRTCERWFMRAAMPSPRHFLAAARVLYAHRLLQDPGFTVEDVAKRLGYSQVRTLQQHARFYLGLTAGEMRLSLTPDAALQLVARRFLTLPHAAAETEAS
ncbi:MAG TPA: helix-turn-helix domain-containing protein [Gemmatimonadales bacterium]|nr:helix-turn-helix domain-containing protein [Gemmatimonadales bacterium]